MLHSYTEYALVIKALSDETRLKIVDMLSNDELCACVILKEFNITQPTLSHHMKKLIDCDLVNARKEGSWTMYSLNKEKYNELLDFLKEIKKVKKTKKYSNLECR